MTMDKGNKLVAMLVGLLIAVVVVQSVALSKLYRKVDSSRPAAVDEPVRMSLQPSAGGPPSGPVKPNPVSPHNPAAPFGGFSLDPDPWDPFSEFRSMRQQMDQMFSDSFSRFKMDPDFHKMWGGTAFSPNMDVEEKGGNYVIRMDIPGADKSNISVNISDRELTVSGKVDETVEEKGQHQLRKERRSGQFSRSLMLPGPVKDDEMEAKYEDGVLVVTVPKADQEEESRRIEVK